MTTLLLTGSSGTIGRVLTDALSMRYMLRLIDRVAQPPMPHPHQTYLADIADMASLERICLSAGDVRYIVHLAADPSVHADWESVLKNNIEGTHHVYECARKFKIRRVIFASTNHVTAGYEGIPPTLHLEKNPRLITVRDSVRPDGDYATSKIFGEATARQYFELYGIQSICLRIGTVTKDGRPTGNDRVKRTWLSPQDLAQLVQKSLVATVDFGIYYGVSNNTGRFWDIENARKDLGYVPVDNAADEDVRMSA